MAITLVPARPELATASSREHGLDWLRVFAFAVLILYHSGMMFVTWDFHLKNPEQSRGLEYVMLFFNRWRLPLLFFISGVGVLFSLRRRSWGKFAGERTVRLLIPLVFGMFVVVPPQIYYERLAQGVQYASYFDFWRTVFDLESYPKGNTSWHHLWFIAYLFVYCLIGIPVFAFLKSVAGQRAIGTVVQIFERWPVAVYLVNVPSLAVALTLGPHWPVTHNLTSDWANLIGSFITFLWGFAVASNRGFLDLITRRRREFLIVGIAVAAIFFAARAMALTQQWPYTPQLLFSSVVSGYFGMAWIFALVGYARALVHQSSPALRYATEAVYPFYIVHQTVLIAIGYYVIGWSAPWLLKFFIVAAGTFTGSWLIYEVIRRVQILRPLFGLRLQSASRPVQ